MIHSTPVHSTLGLLSAAVCLVLSPDVASAAQATSSPWAFEVGAATDNRSKDVSKSAGDPYAWGAATWSSDAGFYAGPAFETIRASNGSRVELAVFGGWASEVMGYEVDLNAEHKWQVDADVPSDDAAWEFTADISRAVGPAEARLRLQHSPDGTGSTRAWTWVSGQVGWEISPRLSASAEVGRREQNGGVDYTGWNLGVTWAAAQGIDFDLRWHDNDADATGDQYDGALVAGVSYAF